MATVVTTVGKAEIISTIKNNPPATYYLGWGTGAGTAAVGDTTLFTEDVSGGYSRVPATLTQITTSLTGDTMQFTGTINAPATETITNMGIFTLITGGTLIYHRDFAGVLVAIAGPNTGIAFTEKIQAS